MEHKEEILVWENRIKSAVEVLTTDNLFQIVQIKYDEKVFGNVLVLLTAYFKSININIRFILDRGDFYCDMGLSMQPKEWFLLSDILTAIGVDTKPDVACFLECISRTSKVIKQNLLLLVQAFDKQHAFDTLTKIKEIEAERVKNMLNKLE